MPTRSNFGGKPGRVPPQDRGARRSTARAVGRDYDEIAKTWSPEVFVRETEQEIIDAGSRSFWGEPFESWRAGNLVGTPEQVSEKLETYAAARCVGGRAVVRRLPGDRDPPTAGGEGDAELPLTGRSHNVSRRTRSVICRSTLA